MTGSASVTNTIPMKKDRTENIQKTYKKCAPYGNCTEIVQKIYRKCAKICNNSNNEPVSTNELLHNLAHFLYIFCTISVQFLYDAHFLYVFCMFSVRSFFIGLTFNLPPLFLFNCFKYSKIAHFFFSLSLLYSLVFILLYCFSSSFFKNFLVLYQFYL